MKLVVAAGSKITEIVIFFPDVSCRIPSETMNFGELEYLKDIA